MAISSPEGCFFARPTQEQGSYLIDLMSSRSPSEAVFIPLCDRANCELAMAHVLRVVFGHVVAPELDETRAQEIALVLPPDCARFSNKAPDSPLI